MKHFKFLGLLMAICLSFFVTPLASALDIGPTEPRYEAAYKLYAASKAITSPVAIIQSSDPVLPPPTSFAIEAIYDRDSKGAAVGASAFWKRFSKGSKYVDLQFFAGLDKRQVPVGALMFKQTWPIADQFVLSYGPAISWKQSKLVGLTLFVGLTLK